jgi:hypothetical protein
MHEINYPIIPEAKRDYNRVPLWDPRVYFILGAGGQVFKCCYAEDDEAGSGTLSPLPEEFFDQSLPPFEEKWFPFDRLVGLAATTIGEADDIDPEEVDAKKVELTQLSYAEVLVLFLKAWRSWRDSLLAYRDSEADVDENNEM